MKNPKRSLSLEVFSGFHDSDLNPQFLAAFLSVWENMASRNPPEIEIALYAIGDYDQPSLFHRSSTKNVGNDHIQSNPSVPSIFVGFSAGCTRAVWRANCRQLKQKNVLGLIAVDGWGMPLLNRGIPSYRWSHDSFTHVSSVILGGQGRFFADPPVAHLSLWERPEQVRGWYCPESKVAMEMSAMQAFVLTIHSLAVSFFDRS